MIEFNHLPVMPKECIEALNIKENETYLDCTVGGAGHSSLICEKLKSGTLLCLDKDENALNVSKKRLERFGDLVKFYHTDFKNFETAMKEYNIKKFDGILVDLGVSSYQIDTPDRGFSYMHNSRLDMRMDQTQKLDAYEIVNNFSQSELSRIFREYGEEQFANNIAKHIVLDRATKPIETTFELVDIIKKSIPAKLRFSGSHPAKKVFQALRIAVNDELANLYETMIKLARSLNREGRLVVLTFHSLEDRIVKNAFNFLKTKCLCPPETLVCCCNHKQEAKLVFKKPVEATIEEKNQNSRSHSAKLRVIEKI